jgi:hypothetical protein
MNWTNKIIVCKKKAYTIEDFIDICISSWTRTEAAKHFDCSEKTLGQVLKEQIPELEPSTAPLGKRLLSLLELKKCSACGEVKIFEEFHVDKYKKDGRTSQCIECRHASEKVYRTENPEKIAAKTAKRRSAKLKRTPEWANLSHIEEFYANCPEGYEVDHIIPLQGKNVSGLHVENNLQYLTVVENRTKSNKYGEE